MDTIVRAHAHRYHKVYMKKRRILYAYLRVLVRDVFYHHGGTTVSRLGNGVFAYDEASIDDTILLRRMHLRPLLVLLVPVSITGREAGVDRFSLNRASSS